MTSLSPDVLKSALNLHNVSVDSAHVPALVDYCKLLWDWNERINLTRHTDIDAFVCRDLIDTLQLSKHIQVGNSVLDVGSGGGVPGIPLAIIREDLTMALAESVSKKAKVLNAIVQDLDLPIRVHDARAENVLKNERFDTLTVRAVAPLRKLLFWFQLHPGQFGRLLLIKGPRWEAEREEAKLLGLTDNVDISVVDEYLTPGHDNKSVILSVIFGDRPAGDKA